MRQKEEDLLKIFAAPVRNLLERSSLDYDRLQEVRLRVQAPLLLRYDNAEYYMDRAGKLDRELKDAYIVSKADIKETDEYIRRSYGRALSPYRAGTEWEWRER